MVTGSCAEAARAAHLHLCVDAAGAGPAPFGFLPAALMPLGSRPFLEHVIGRLVRCGVSELTVFAGPWASVVRALLLGGAPWNVRITVRHEPDRAAPTLAGLVLSGHEHVDLPPGPPAPGAKGALFAADTLVGLVRANADLLAGRVRHIDEPAVERSPRVRVSAARVRVSRRARLVGPVILGPDVVVGAGAGVGPNAILTDRVVVGPGARVRDSLMAGGMALRRGGEACGLLAIAGVVGEAVFPTRIDPAALGLAALPAGRRLYGVRLPRGLCTPAP